MRNPFKTFSAARNPRREQLLTALIEKTENGTVKWRRIINGCYEASEVISGSGWDAKRAHYKIRSWGHTEDITVEGEGARVVYGTFLSPACDKLWEAIMRQTNPASKRNALINQLS